MPKTIAVRPGARTVRSREGARPSQETRRPTMETKTNPETWTLGLTTFTTLVEADDLRPEIVAYAETLSDLQYPDRVDWADFWDRLDGLPLDDGTNLDLGPQALSPMMQRVRKHIVDYRKD